MDAILRRCSSLRADRPTWRRRWAARVFAALPALGCAALLAVGAPARAAGLGGPAADRLLAVGDGSAAACASADAHDPLRRSIEAEARQLVLRFAGTAVPLDIADCDEDGRVLADGRVRLSLRLRRLTPAQRAFVVAHELAHLRLAHAGQVQALAAEVAARHADAASTRIALAAELPPLSHRAELAADAWAVRTLAAAGFAVDEVLAWFDAMPSPFDTPSHPSPGRRAAAMRAALGDAAPAGAVSAYGAPAAQPGSASARSAVHHSASSATPAEPGRTIQRR